MRNIRLVPGALLLSLTMLAGGWTVSASADEVKDRIMVTGEGTATIAPDMALLGLTVARQATTAREALDANSAAMAEVLAAMNEEGVAERDLQTANFAIQPNYFYPPQKANGEREPPRIVGYTVRNSLSVRIRDLGKLGKILDKSVTLGVNEGGNISFTNDDPSAAIADARVRAVKQAMMKASTLAQAAGVSVGNILEISEQSYTPRPMPMANAQMARGMMASDSVPVAAGESAYKVTVNMQFRIDQ